MSKRLSDIPAIIVSPFPSSMKTYIQLMDPSQLEAFKTNHTMEVNPNHKLIISLNSLRKVDLPAANMMIRQLLDNTLLACGLLLDPTDYVSKVIDLMQTSIDHSIHASNAVHEIYAHRPFEGGRVPFEVHETDAAPNVLLKDAYRQMQTNLQSKVKASAEVEIGTDGKPRVK
jgi:hypothetical protein